MIKLEHVPKYSEMIEYYGNPDLDADGVADSEWLAENTSVFELPFSLRYSWKPGILKYVRLHNLVGPAVVDAEKEIQDKMGLRCMRPEFNEYGGAFNYRLAKGANSLSTHSCAAAIDRNPTIAGWQVDPKYQPKEIVEAYKARGFTWGGDWPEKWFDGQHFQAVR